jgi:hypothetical protein
MTGKEKECLKTLSLTDPADEELRLVMAIDYGTAYTGILSANGNNIS